MFKYLVTLLLTLSLISAQELKVIEILDANLFRTEDSTFISMVNLEVPSVDDTDTIRVELAKKAIKFAKIQLLKRQLRFQETYRNSCTKNDKKKGNLFRLYPLGDTNINKLYLQNGYAVYVPCDTLYMDIYRDAGMMSMNKNLGIWQPFSKASKPDMFNRFRFSFLLVEQYLKHRSFPPFFGLNYRWSDLISIVDKEPLNFNLSAETGTFIYVFLPYINLGSELRYKNFYGRIHYDGAIPFYFFLDSHPETFNFWGFDFGFIIPFNHRGIEVEFNAKRKDDFYIGYISISFAAY